MGKNEIKLESIYLENVIAGKCKMVGSKLEDMQRELMKVVAENNASISGGAYTRVEQVDIIEGGQILSIEVGLLCDRPIFDSGKFEFIDCLELNNIVTFNYVGNEANLSQFVDDTKMKIDLNNYKLTGRVYNHIKYRSISESKITASIYFEIKKNYQNI